MKTLVESFGCAQDKPLTGYCPSGYEFVDLNFFLLQQEERLFFVRG